MVYAFPYATFVEGDPTKYTGLASVDPRPDGGGPGCKTEGDYLVGIRTYVAIIIEGCARRNIIHDALGWLSPRGGSLLMDVQAGWPCASMSLLVSSRHGIQL